MANEKMENYFSFSFPIDIKWWEERRKRKLTLFFFFFNSCENCK